MCATRHSSLSLSHASGNHGGCRDVISFSHPPSAKERALRGAAAHLLGGGGGAVQLEPPWCVEPHLSQTCWKLQLAPRVQRLF
jgi:hypothetical protein